LFYFGYFKEEEAAAFGAAIQSIWNYHREKEERVEINEIAGKMVRF
jgi:hypothetical protein